MSQVDQLVLLLTTACPWQCSYCYLDCGPTGQHMPLEVALAALEAFAPGPGGMVVQLSGGEPMLVPEVVWAVAEAARGMKGVRVALQSSGYALGPSELRRLRRLGVGVGVSLDGPPGINELTRGKGATEAALEALTAAAKVGMVVGITSVVCRMSLGGVVELVAMCGAMECVGVVNLDLLRPVGRADKDMLPEARELKMAMARVAEAVEFVNARRWPPLGVRELSRLGSSKPGPYCAPAGGRGVCVAPDGRLYPCPSLVGRREFELGSVWHPRLEGLEQLSRQWMWPQECRECELLVACRGGCPVRRMAVCGSVRARSGLECAMYHGLAGRWR